MDTVRWRRPGFLVPYLAGLLASAALLTHSCIEHRNTLHRNGRWDSTKVHLARRTMGAVAFLTTHTALAKSELNLGAWHGFQEVLYQEPLDAAEVDFDFRVEPGAYFSFLHHKDERGFEALRLSRNDRFPSAALSANTEGAILRTTPLSATLGPGWNHLHVSFRDGLKAELNGAPLHSGPSAPGTWLLGFRGSLNPVVIDNVEIRTRAGAILRDDFSNSHTPVLPVFLAMLGAVLVLNLILAVIRRPRAPRLFASLALCAALLVFAVVDWFFLAGTHPKIVLDFGGYQNTIEDRATVVERIRHDYAGEKPHPRRILFLGASQTWGAGAARPEEVYVARVEAALNREAGERRFECINTGISGEWAPAIVDLYRKEWRALEPEIVVVDLGNNDGDVKRFGEVIESLAQENEERKLRTLFILEPNSVESDDATLLKKHALVREAASRHHMPVLALHEELGRRAGEGFLFWDFVHLTSFGHQLAAARVVEMLRPML